MKRNPRTRENEERLFGFARSYLAEAFPNPDRIGCPPVGELQRLAELPRLADPAITEHLGACSPCFQQYQSLLAETRTERKRMSRWRNGLKSTSLWLLIIALICLLLIGLLIATWNGPTWTVLQLETRDQLTNYLSHRPAEHNTLSCIHQNPQYSTCLVELLFTSALCRNSEGFIRKIEGPTSLTLRTAN